MKSGLQVGLALALGYFLGRHHKFKLAIALAVAGATGKLGGLRGDLLEQGVKLLGSSPDVQRIVDSVRGDLFEAGKAAAKAAASRQVSSLGTRLQERADTLRHAADMPAEAGEAGARAAGGATRTARSGVSVLREKAVGGGRPRRRAEEEEPYEDEYEDESGEYEDEEPERPRRGNRSVDRDRDRPEGRRSRRAAKADEEPEDERDDDRDENPDDSGERSSRRRVVRDPDQAERSRPVRRTKG